MGVAIRVNNYMGLGRISRPGAGVRLRAVLVVCFLSPWAVAATAASQLQNDLSHLFIGRSFTIRNFYRGGHLHYDSQGQPTEKPESGYWSREGMVEISSVKIAADSVLSMRGRRNCVLFDTEAGEFIHVYTGDTVEIDVQLGPDQMNLAAAVPLMQRIFITSREPLATLVPPYWKNCLAGKVSRADKHGLWECDVPDKATVPAFAGKKVVWENPVPDTSLHNGMELFNVQHHIGYLAEDGVKLPSLAAGRDPLFQWQERRTRVDAITLVLAMTVGEDGKPHDITVVTPVGMGLDDDGAHAVEQWRFTPGMLDGKPHAVHARVVFEVAAPNSRPTFPLRY